MRTIGQSQRLLASWSQDGDDLGHQPSWEACSASISKGLTQQISSHCTNLTAVHVHTDHTDFFFFFFFTEMLSRFLILHSVYHKQITKSGKSTCLRSGMHQNTGSKIQDVNVTRSRRATFDPVTPKPNRLRGIHKLAVRETGQPQHSNRLQESAQHPPVSKNDIQRRPDQHQPAAATIRSGGKKPRYVSHSEKTTLK